MRTLQFAEDIRSDLICSVLDFDLAIKFYFPI
jgi:hypothetical protein